MISPGGVVPLLADSGPLLWLPKEDRMPAERATMRQVREVLRLNNANLSVQPVQTRAAHGICTGSDDKNSGILSHCKTYYVPAMHRMNGMIPNCNLY